VVAPSSFPPGLWTLPGSLRGDRPALGTDVALDGVLQTLEIQGSIAPYRCLTGNRVEDWKGRARPRVLGALMALALIGSFAAVSFWEDESGLLGAVALVALLLPLG
jgi:hypothetical protein